MLDDRATWRRKTRRAAVLLTTAASLFAGLDVSLASAQSIMRTPNLNIGSRVPTINPIVCENQNTGDSGFDITGAGEPSIQGFAADISVNTGQAVDFKIQTPSTNYKIDIYRLGYYVDGAGARKITTLGPFTEAQNQAATCATDPATGLFDCGNWAVSASWNTTGATSGIGRAVKRRRHGFASRRAQRVERDWRALSVEMPVLAYICR